MDRALGIAGDTGRRPNRIGCFLDQQSFVAMHGIERLQAAAKLCGEAIQCELHGSLAVYPS
jgi:hypothetical protein